jgi:prepilin peptidase CpaA
MKIPNKLSACGVASGLLLHAAFEGWNGICFALKGMGVGFGCLIVLYWLHALGAGDVKLFAAIGSLAGSEFVLNCIVNSILFACLFGIVILMCKRKAMRRIRNLLMLLFALIFLRDKSYWDDFVSSEEHLRFPFMVAVVPGAIAAAAI